MALPAGKYTVKVEPSDLLEEAYRPRDPDGRRTTPPASSRWNRDNPPCRTWNFWLRHEPRSRARFIVTPDRSESLEDGEKPTRA